MNLNNFIKFYVKVGVKINCIKACTEITCHR